MQVRAKKHRLPEIAYRGFKVVSFTACIKGRQRPFEDKEIVGKFVELLSGSVQVFQCVVPLYCFMPDHLHLLISGRSEQSRIKTSMDRFKMVSSKWFATEKPSFQWQANYYDHIVRHAEDLAAHIRYIMANPVRAGLVDEWSEYPFTGSIEVDLVEYLRDLEESRKFGFRY